jgi:hypothetical protein
MRCAASLQPRVLKHSLCALNTQVCQAHRADGGRVVVVMSQREKLDMESLYRCEEVHVLKQFDRPVIVMQA